MTIAIIQARVQSTRLPNKVFAEIKGHPLIWHVVNRISNCKNVEKIVLATTENPKDDALEKWAKDNGIPSFRGSENDVLARYYFAAKKFNASTIVRITSDDPFKDPVITDRVIQVLKEKNLDFTYNNNPPTFPEGLDTEVFSFAALERAHLSSNDPFEREHVTQYMYRHPELFKQENVAYRKNLSKYRWTIDNVEDLEMAREVYNELFDKKPIFLMDDILKLFQVKPDIPTINSEVKRSAMYVNA